MTEPSKPSAKSLRPRFPVAKQLAVISSLSRWHILNELLNSEPLPVCEIACRLRASETSISKHLAVLLAAGIVQRHYGLYALDSRFIVPGERSLDFGSVLIRFSSPS